MAKQAAQPQETSAIQKAGTQALAQEQVPEFLRDRQGDRTGTEDMDQADMTLPRLAICQALSPFKKKTDSKYIAGLEDGQLFNTVTGQIYGESIDLVPLFLFKNFTKFTPIDEGGGIECVGTMKEFQIQGKLVSIIEGKLHPVDLNTGQGGCNTCPHSQFNDGKPECDKFYNYVCLIHPIGELVVVSMKATAIKVAKQWNTLIKLTNYPMYATIWTMGSALKKKGEQEWYLPRPIKKGFVAKEFFDQAESFFKSLREKSIMVDTTGEVDEPGSDDFDTKDM